MRPSLWVATAAFLLTTSAGHAQFHGGFGYRQGVAVQVRTGPFSGFTYFARSYGFGYGPVYPPPGWYYAPNGFLAPQPPIIIQNIIQAPAVAAAPAGRGAVVPAEFEAAAPRPQAPKVAKPALKPPPPPVIIPDIPKPKAEGRPAADRLAEAGRKAFADGQHGRALELFRRAADITPNEPSAHYLVAQPQFALGKYREAVAAIAAGMALRADWSEARFKSRDLYFKKPDLFDDHLKALRQALEMFPDDPALLFLLGHQLWFDGKQEEAKALILKARARG